MKEYISKIKIFDSEKISDIEKYTLHTQTEYFSYIAKIKMFLLAKLLKVNEAELFLFKTKNQLAFRSFLSSLTLQGFIKSYGEGLVFCDYPKFLKVSITYYLDKNKLMETQKSWGYVLLNESKELAYAKALGEALERNATFFLKDSSCNVYPKISFGEASFLYEYLPKFTKKQIISNERLLSSREDLQHVRGFDVSSLTGDKKHFLPLSCTYWGGIIEGKDKIIFHETSSGSGGGLVYEQALLSAVYELIERDHFLLYWFSGVQPNIISNESISGPFGEYVKKIIEEYALEIYFLDTRYDLEMKSCVCIIIDPILNIIAMGGKAGTSSVEVLKSALLESMMVMTAIREQENHIKEVDLAKIIEEKTFLKNLNHTDRVRLYCSPSGINLIRKQFLRGLSIQYSDFSSLEKNFSSYKDEVKSLLNSFKGLIEKKGKGYHIYEHRARSKWTEETNYEVVHVFIPSFLKLHLQEKFATPVSERLFVFAKEKGKILHHENDIVTLPHFFP
jgi:ribosomal protein S12 methylthiotransferase accessory factor